MSERDFIIIFLFSLQKHIRTASHGTDVLIVSLSEKKYTYNYFRIFIQSKLVTHLCIGKFSCGISNWHVTFLLEHGTYFIKKRKKLLQRLFIGKK